MFAAIHLILMGYGDKCEVFEENDFMSHEQVMKDLG